MSRLTVNSLPTTTIWPLEPPPGVERPDPHRVALLERAQQLALAILSNLDRELSAAELGWHGLQKFAPDVRREALDALVAAGRLTVRETFAIQARDHKSRHYRLVVRKGGR